MCEEKRIDDRPEEADALKSGRLVPIPFGEIYLRRINDFQLNKEVAKGTQESDLPIVVRDGSTDCHGEGSGRNATRTKHPRQRKEYPR